MDLVTLIAHLEEDRLPGEGGDGGLKDLVSSESPTDLASTQLRLFSAPGAEGSRDSG